MEIKLSLPAIERYRDYRKFLKDYYDFKKSHRVGFSFRKFAQNAGIKSPNYLQLVMKGDRNLSESMAEQVAEAMDLTLAQRRYFISLVRQENSVTDEELSRAQEESLIALKKLVAKYLSKNKEKVLSDWHYLLIRELVALKEFQPTGEYISNKLQNLISSSEAEMALRLLTETGFLLEEKGQYKIVDPVIDTGDTLFSDEIMKRYHARTLKLWADNLKNWDSKTMETSVLNLSLSSAKLPELQRRIRDFQDQILGWLQDEKDVDSVIQLGTYMIPHVISKNK